MSDSEVNKLHNSDENTAVVKTDKTEKTAKPKDELLDCYAEMRADPAYKRFKAINRLIFVIYLIVAGICFAPMWALVAGLNAGTPRVVAYLKILSAIGVIVFGLSAILAVFHCKRVGVKAEKFEQIYFKSLCAKTPGKVRNRQIEIEKVERDGFITLTVIAVVVMAIFSVKNYELTEARLDYRDGIELIHQGEYMEAAQKLNSMYCKEYRDSKGLVVYCYARDCYNDGSVGAARKKLGELHRKYRITNSQMAKEIEEFDNKVNDEYPEYLKKQEEQRRVEAERESRANLFTTEPVETTTKKKRSYRTSYQKEDKDDSYNPEDYYDPEDFYDDYYDDFADYDEGEDYYYDYGD